LLAAVKKRLRVIDPKFTLPEDFNQYTMQDEVDANEDVNAFLAEMNETDKKIRGDDKGVKPSKAIFEE